MKFLVCSSKKWHDYNNHMSRHEYIISGVIKGRREEGRKHVRDGCT